MAVASFCMSKIENSQQGIELRYDKTGYNQITDITVRHLDVVIKDSCKNCCWLLDDHSKVFIKLSYHLAGSRTNLIMVVHLF